MTDDALLALIRAIARGSCEQVHAALAQDPTLARTALQQGATRADPSTHFLVELSHHVYAGDTALHVAAAAHDIELIDVIAAEGAGVSARNRRRATPLHYACDGAAGSADSRQSRAVEALVGYGADLEATDRSGTTPLLRAIRNRCAGAVEALLEAGADPTAVSSLGTSALTLATTTTGKSGSGSDDAKAAQSRILELLGT